MTVVQEHASGILQLSSSYCVRSDKVSSEHIICQYTETLTRLANSNRKQNAKNILSFNYFSLTLQQINIALDEVFLLKLMNLEKSLEPFFKPKVQSTERVQFEEGEKLLHPNREVEELIVEKQREKKIIDEELPTKVSITARSVFNRLLSDLDSSSNSTLKSFKSIQSLLISAS